MSAATAMQFQSQPDRSRVSKPRLISLERFLESYTDREDAFKYEWNKGVVEKKPRTMNRDQFLIFQHLIQRFLHTKAFAQQGMMICEVDMYLPTVDRTRRADIAYLSGAQMAASKNGIPTVCPFVIEVISKNDQVNEVDEKIIEYFENGVEVVWTIFPKLKKVEVHRSLKDITICFGDDLCSGAPVLPDFEISVNELFR